MFSVMTDHQVAAYEAEHRHPVMPGDGACVWCERRKWNERERLYLAALEHARTPPRGESSGTLVYSATDTGGTYVSFLVHSRPPIIDSFTVGNGIMFVTSWMEKTKMWGWFECGS